MDRMMDNVFNDKFGISKQQEKCGKEYYSGNNSNKIKSFDYNKSSGKSKLLSLEEMQSKLKENSILCEIRMRGNRAISFQDLPCPVCGKTSANARAYPPYYNLYCFNSNCSANEGLPLIEWCPEIAKKHEPLHRNFNIKDLNLKAPDRFDVLSEAQTKIKEAINNNGNCLVLATPGVGKSFTALETISRKKNDNVIIYSCLNKKLRDEAYEKMIEISDSDDNIRKLEAREDLCMKKDEHKEITEKGFSPSTVLCSKCEYRNNWHY